MDAALFVGKFVAITVFYLAIVSAGLYGICRFETTPLTVQQAIARILGTHLGRLRFLLLAAVASLVLTVLYPGPPLLLPEGSLQKMGEIGHHLLWGNNPAHPYVPPQPGRTSWFWGQATLLYLGAFVMYIVLAIPNLLSSALQAARSVSGNTSNGSPRSNHLIWAAMGAFVGVFVMYLRNKKPA